MAVLSLSRDALVIRVVYDGPPMAGKTTSVRSLAGKLGGEVAVPEEVEGRTLYFDWLDYTGGLFEGRRIRCQIVSVPGQATLASRRRQLLETADVVVFVSDSTADAVDQTSHYIAGLKRVLGALPGPPVGIVVQANKRDRPNAVTLQDLNARLEHAGSRAAVIESVATAGVGIRETFVFAVRLALDRVRELIRTQQLTHADPAIDSAEDLLRDIRSAEGDSLASVADAGLKHTRLSDVRSIAEQSLSQVIQGEALDVAAPASDPRASAWAKTNAAPALPHEHLPGGMIWPPVEGRMTLHEIANDQFELKQRPNGDWCGVVGEKWLIQSPAEAKFDDLETGRSAILNWARLHSGCQRFFSGHRSIVLAPDGQGGYRLWQIIAQSPALRGQVEFAMRVGVGSMIASLVDSTQLLLRAHREWIDDASDLPITLATVGESSGAPRFVGLMPFPMNSSASPRGSIDWSQVIAEDLRPELITIRRLRDELLETTLSEPNQSWLPRNLRTDPAAVVVEDFLRSV